MVLDRFRRARHPGRARRVARLPRLGCRRGWASRRTSPDLLWARSSPGLESAWHGMERVLVVARIRSWAAAREGPVKKLSCFGKKRLISSVVTAGIAATMLSVVTAPTASADTLSDILGDIPGV